MAQTNPTLITPQPPLMSFSYMTLNLCVKTFDLLVIQEQAITSLHFNRRRGENGALIQLKKAQFMALVMKKSSSPCVNYGR